MRQPIPLILEPGLYTDDAGLIVQKRWEDGYNVRFVRGLPELIGGWQQYLTGTLTGTCRAIRPWRDLSGNHWTAYGTHSKLMVEKGNTISDITPSGLTAGLVSATTLSSTAWGAGTWGSGPWGGSSTAYGYNQPRIWSLDTWGEDLVATTSDTNIVYVWDASVGTGTAATAITGAPTASWLFVSDEDRHLVLLGAGGDPLLVQWSGQEDYTQWTPSETTSAGDRRLDVGNYILGHTPTRGGHLIFTDEAVYVMTFIGGEFVFSISKLGENCGLAAPNAVVTRGGVAYWMGYDKFWKSDGGSLTPIDCPVRDRVFDNLNKTQGWKICAGVNSKFDEIQFFLPTSTNENDYGVVYCEPTDGAGSPNWYLTNFGRTAWVDRGLVTQNPIATTAAGVVLKHEVGDTDESGSAVRYQIKSGELQLSEGQQMMHISRIIPEWERISGSDHLVTVNVRQFPQRTATSKGPYNMASEYISLRARGRTAQVEFTGSGDFRWGRHTIYVQPHGGRP